MSAAIFIELSKGCAEPRAWPRRPGVTVCDPVTSRQSISSMLTTAPQAEEREKRWYEKKIEFQAEFEIERKTQRVGKEKREQKKEQKRAEKRLANQSTLVIGSDSQTKIGKETNRAQHQINKANNQTKKARGDGNSPQLELPRVRQIFGKYCFLQRPLQPREELPS
ncbi:hypothetical protein B0H10DRAFT_1939475 [Mycena sp. CBHHK59/15]|nr:hypothetical protein B0H10DRAFT_1939475 [Mycena sp. CBHHK59/15]